MMGELVPQPLSGSFNTYIVENRSVVEVTGKMKSYVVPLESAFVSEFHEEISIGLGNKHLGTGTVSVRDSLANELDGADS